MREDIAIAIAASDAQPLYEFRSIREDVVISVDAVSPAGKTAAMRRGVSRSTRALLPEIKSIKPVPIVVLRLSVVSSPLKLP